MKSKKKITIYINGITVGWRFAMIDKDGKDETQK